MDALSFGWLSSVLSGFVQFLQGATLVTGVSLFGFLLALCCIIIVIRSLLLKG